MTNIHIQNGFTQKERKRLIPFDQAASYLNSRRKRHITRAQQQEDGICVISHSFRCPYCGKEVPAYSYSEQELPDRKAVEAWCDPVSKAHKAPLPFRTPLQRKNLMFCPRCGMESSYNQTETILTLESDEKTISLSRKVSVLDLLEIPWIKSLDAEGNETFFEELIFDLADGIGYVILRTEENKVFAFHPLMSRVKTEEVGFFSILLKQHTVVRRALKRAFREAFTRPLPYTLRELDLNHFLILTMFQDYPAEFYNAIPWDKNTGWICQDFSDLDKLKKPACALEQLEQIQIPYMISFKHFFSQNPGLFFYLKECRQLWDLLEDTDLFFSLLRSKDVYYMLASLHQYPGAMLYLTDYKKAGDSRSLAQMLRTNFQMTLCRAVAYAALSPLAQKAAMNAATKGMDADDFCYIRPREPLFSYPLAPLPAEGKEIHVDGFTFKWLKNSADSMRASIELDCSPMYRYRSNQSVAVVLKGREYVAAIEIDQGEVSLYIGKSGDLIDEGTPLHEAIEKWAKHFSFPFPAIDEGDLPF